MPAIRYKESFPQIERDVFVAPSAWVIGAVTLKSQSSLFFGAVLRGDIFPIEVGAGSNIQENCVLHTSHGIGPCIVGSNCTIGHSAILHGCTLKDRVLVGMHSTILDRAVIGSDCIIGANSLVTQGTQIPDGSLVLGSPAKVVRQLTTEERHSLVSSARGYIEHAAEFIKIFA